VVERVGEDHVVTTEQSREGSDVRSIPTGECQCRFGVHPVGQLAFQQTDFLRVAAYQA